MSAPTETLSKIQSLAELYQTGYQSNVVDTTIDKLITMERERLCDQAHSLAERMREFERKHQLSSNEFAQRFAAGEMGDEAEFFEWNAFHEMWLSVHERLKTLGA